MKEYFVQHPKPNKQIQHNKGSCNIQKRISKFNPKIWTYFNKKNSIGNDTVTNFLCQSENPVHKNKTQKKQVHLIKLENMEAVKARITAKSLFIEHIVHVRHEGAINFAYDTVIRAELLYKY